MSAANTVEDLAWCLNVLYSGQVDHEEDDQADEDNQADEDDQADEEEHDYLEVCAARLATIGESYSMLDESVRQDFEA